MCFFLLGSQAHATRSGYPLTVTCLTSLVESVAHVTVLSLFQTTIKVYAKCLRSDIEYKTLGITYQTTCREVVSSLLNKYRMRHRDPNLFYLTMEVTLRKAGLRTVLALDEEARPAALQSCHPRGDSKFALQMRRGGLVKIYDSVLMPGSQYKSLLIAERTTVDELIQILLNCYNSQERVEQFSLFEVCNDQEYQRKLHPDDCPLQVQHTWLRDLNFHFLVKRNSDYRRSKSSWSSPEPPSLPSSSRNEPRSSFSSSSLCSSASSSSSEESTARYSCYSEYDNYFYT
ncbi:hypothetical protein RUM43_009181 [Polyplax serrata]|uniref:Ras-associating domain-containing protein n=1 Tax=Polyplax serrata TaxID=468196 RepID=A0AAN8RU81_POLSC